MTLEEFMQYYDGNNYHRISLWTGAVETGKWLGQFPVTVIPNDYKSREIVNFSVCPYDDVDSHPCMWVVIK